MAAFDWTAMMRVGIGQLRIPVDEFWRMTPAELMLVINPDGTLARPMGRSGFDAMQAQFPDENGGLNE